MKSKNNKTLKVLSLFTGCGGMDLGFEGGFTVLRKSINPKLHPDWVVSPSKKRWVRLPKTRFKTIFANDIVRAAKASWVPFFMHRGKKDDNFKLGSIVDLVKQYRNGNTKIFSSADIITGGFPCQDFSVAGKRNGFKSHKGHHGKLLSAVDNPSMENRGQLYMWMKYVIEIVKPKVFVAENVKGLMSLAEAKKIIENDFRNIGSGYIVVDAQVLYAPRYGVPQSRERVFFIGFRRDALKKTAAKALLAKNELSEEFNPYPIPTHGPQDVSSFKRKKLLSYVTAGDYLLDLDEPEMSDDLSHQAYSKAKWYGNHCQGQTEVDLSGLGPTIRAEHHGNIEFRRLDIEHGGKYDHEHDLGSKERRLSVRECARLQTFPDDFEFVRKPSEQGIENKLSASEGYKLVGNAVPPLLAFHIAWRLQELWPKLMKS